MNQLRFAKIVASLIVAGIVLGNLFFAQRQVHDTSLIWLLGFVADIAFMFVVAFLGITHHE